LFAAGKLNYLRPGLPTHAVPLPTTTDKVFLPTLFCAKAQVAAQSKENPRQRLSFYFSLFRTNGQFNFKYSILSDQEFACDTLCEPTLYFDSHRLTKYQVLNSLSNWFLNFFWLAIQMMFLLNNPS
jgi:hypothetical protein